MQQRIRQIRFVCGRSNTSAIRIDVQERKNLCYVAMLFHQKGGLLAVHGFYSLLAAVGAEKKLSLNLYVSWNVHVLVDFVASTSLDVQMLNQFCLLCSAVDGPTDTPKKDSKGSYYIVYIISACICASTFSMSQ